MKRRVKLNSKNFKVAGGTVVYIAKATPIKPEPREEVVETIRKVWNSQPAKLIKHIKKLSIVTTVGTRQVTGGYYDSRTTQIKFYDARWAKVSQYESTAVHELAHAQFHVMYKYHKEALKKFCEAVIQLPAMNRYQSQNERNWRRTISNQKVLDNHEEKWFNQWPSEIHSFIAEYEHNPELLESFHEVYEGREDELLQARIAYKKLHEEVGA